MAFVRESDYEAIARNLQEDIDALSLRDRGDAWVFEQAPLAGSTATLEFSKQYLEDGRLFTFQQLCEHSETHEEGMRAASMLEVYAAMRSAFLLLPHPQYHDTAKGFVKQVADANREPVWANTLLQVGGGGCMVLHALRTHQMASADLLKVEKIKVWKRGDNSSFGDLREHYPDIAKKVAAGLFGDADISRIDDVLSGYFISPSTLDPRFWLGGGHRLNSQMGSYGILMRRAYSSAHTIVARRFSDSRPLADLYPAFAVKRT